MIPKIIHYCWFGTKELPKSAKKCIASWKKYFPDYEIKEWNESNFDYSGCSYAKEAAQAGKWAFVSDYARFKILYQFGGIYFDTDVEVIAPMDDLLSKGNILGFECDNPKNVNEDSDVYVAPGLIMAFEPGVLFLKDIINKYELIHFNMPDGSQNINETVCTIVSSYFDKYGLLRKNIFQNIVNVNIYPSDYFDPYYPSKKQLCMTSNTRSIHYYNASWFTTTMRIKRLIINIFGINAVTKIYQPLKNYFIKNK